MRAARSGSCDSAVRSSVAIRIAVSSISRSMRCRSQRAGGELLRAQIALDLELPEVFEQGPLARREVVGLALQGLDAGRRPAGHRLGSGGVLGQAARGERRGQDEHPGELPRRPAAPGSARGGARGAAGRVAGPWHGRQKRGLPSISFGTGTPKYFSTVGPRSMTRGSCTASLRFEMSSPGIVL